MLFIHRTYPWKQFIDGITLDEMYPYSAAYIPDLLYSLGTAKIVNVSYFNVGTQVKFDILFEDGNKAVAKPMRSVCFISGGLNQEKNIKSEVLQSPENFLFVANHPEFFIKC